MAASGNLQCLLKLGLSPAHRNCLPQAAGQCGYTPSLSGGVGGADTADPVIEKLQGGEHPLSVAVAKLRRK